MSDPKPTTTMDRAREGELRAILRIDAAPEGKRFQGVWLELAGDKRWVVDYRAHELWRPFEGREVIVSGYCWAPDPRAQAIEATHFHVEHMTFVKPELGRGPLLAIGPEQALRGAVRAADFPAGSKRAGAPEPRFEQYGIQGASVALPEPGTRVLVIAREIEPDMSWTAQTGGPKLWILDVRAEDAAVTARTKIACPR